MYYKRVFVAVVFILAENIFVSGQGLLNQLMQDAYGPEVHRQAPTHHAPPPLPPHHAARNNYPIQIDPKVLEAVFGSSFARSMEETPQELGRAPGGAKPTSLRNQEDKQSSVVPLSDVQKINGTGINLDDRLLSPSTIVSKWKSNHEQETQSKPEQLEDGSFTYTNKPHDLHDHHEPTPVDNNHLTESGKSHDDDINHENRPVSPRLHLPLITEDTNHESDDSAHISGVNPHTTVLSGFLEPTGTEHKHQGKTKPSIEEATKEHVTRTNTGTKNTKNSSTKNVASFSFFIGILLLFVL